MKKKAIYPLLAGALILMSFILLEGTTKKTKKPKHPLTSVSFSVVNNFSLSWTEIDIIVGGSVVGTLTPSVPTCTCYPTTDDFTVKVYFTSTMTNAIQITDADDNTLCCSPSGSGSTRTLVHCLGSSTSAQIAFYTSQFCP